MTDDPIRRSAATLIAALSERRMLIATAESCTGGLVAAALTDIPGASEVVYGGFVTYANEAKFTMIGVDEALIARYGAVSAEVARAMAEGARNTAMVDVALAITGIAGPGGGSAEKPVGLVHIACATAAGTSHTAQRFGPLSRQEIRAASVRAALDLGLACIKAPG